MIPICTATANGTATPTATSGLTPVVMAKVAPTMVPMMTLGGCAPASGASPIQTSSRVPPTRMPVGRSPRIRPTSGPSTTGRWKWVRPLNRSSPAKNASMPSKSPCNKLISITIVLNQMRLKMSCAGSVGTPGQSRRRGRPAGRETPLCPTRPPIPSCGSDACRRRSACCRR